MARNDAVFMPVKCKQNQKIFYARYDYAFDKKWVLSYGLKYMPPQEETIGTDSEGKVVTIDVANSRRGPQYKCPYCGNREYVRCGSCGELTCYSGKGKFTCAHCGNTGEVNGTIESMQGNRHRTQV